VLSACLLTVEDEGPQFLYEAIREELSKRLFVRRGVVRLSRPDRQEHRWVETLEEWRRVIDSLTAEHDLVFCTVDLRIPATAGGEPDVANGLAVVREVQARRDDGVRCCVLTGLSGMDLQRSVGPGLADVPFDFKTDEQWAANAASYLESQALSLIRELRFPDAAERTEKARSSPDERRVHLDEASGRLRDHYLARASYYADEATWHVPTLLVGRPGLGRRTLLSFLAYLAGAELIVIDLAAASAQNADNYRRLGALQREIEAGIAPGAAANRRLYYVANLDAYVPGVSGEESENCLWPLNGILRGLAALGPRPSSPCPVGLALSIAGEVRLRIPLQQTRAAIRLLEDVIGQMTGLPLAHVGLDENGWPLEHPRVVRLPSLAARGTAFVREAARVCLEGLSGGRAVRLEPDVEDLLLAKTDWSDRGNLGGLTDVLGRALASLDAHGAAGQLEISRALLPEDVRRRLEKTVFNVHDVELSLPGPGGNPLRIIQRAAFHVQEGELLVILGPSGCGKSSMLRLLAGLHRPSGGSISFRGQPLTGPSALVGFIFQDYSLFPWLTVRRNVEFGPRATGEASKLGAPIDRLLEAAGLEAFERSYPHQLSGGMRQRVAIIRALANDPVALLMDEPFGALDVQKRWEMQDFLLKTKRQTGKTIVFVTHDVDEAVYVGDRILIASPRPLRLEREFFVPFSGEVRHAALRRDPLFVTLVNRVREVLLAAL
jgi:ABC-type nitrate/sulfonate/bicarbonate transport system ATPase subunit